MGIIRYSEYKRERITLETNFIASKIRSRTITALSRSTDLTFGYMVMALHKKR